MLNTSFICHLFSAILKNSCRSIFVDPCCFPLFAKVLFIYSFTRLVLAYVPLIAIPLNAAIALFARAPSVSECKFEASIE